MKEIDTSGTGVGLAISKGIVECHGGQLVLQEAGHKSKGSPTVFRILLPVSPLKK